jgi:hypothetical protein
VSLRVWVSKLARAGPVAVGDLFGAGWLDLFVGGRVTRG